MPVSRSKRRGPSPQDRKLFAAKHLPALREAVSDLSWLRSRGYAETSSLKLVGDRLALTARQRTAVGRCACSDQGRDSRKSRRLSLSDIRDRDLLIDGFNLLITIEAALGDGILLRGRDGCIRDMSSMHGNYRLLADTEAALELIFEAINRLRPGRVIWYLDKPVSNSGKLKALIAEVAAKFPDLTSQVRLVKDPDPILARASDEVGIATADSGILEKGGRWVNLADYIVTLWIPDAEILDLVNDSTDPAATPESGESRAVPALRKITSETAWHD